MPCQGSTLLCLPCRLKTKGLAMRGVLARQTRHPRSSHWYQQVEGQRSKKPKKNKRNIKKAIQASKTTQICWQCKASVAFTSLINMINRWANPSEISEFWGLDRIGGAPNGIGNPWKCYWNPNPNDSTLMIRWNWHVSVTQVSRISKFLAVHSSYMFNHVHTICQPIFEVPGVSDLNYTIPKLSESLPAIEKAASKTAILNKHRQTRWLISDETTTWLCQDGTNARRESHRSHRVISSHIESSSHPKVVTEWHLHRGTTALRLLSDLSSHRMWMWDDLSGEMVRNMVLNDDPLEFKDWNFCDFQGQNPTASAASVQRTSNKISIVLGWIKIRTKKTRNSISCQYVSISHDGSMYTAYIYIYTNIKGVFVDGIHGTPYIAAPWSGACASAQNAQNFQAMTSGQGLTDDRKFSITGWVKIEHPKNWCYHLRQRKSSQKKWPHSLVPYTFTCLDLNVSFSGHWMFRPSLFDMVNNGEQWWTCQKVLFSSCNPGVYSHIAFKLDQPQEEHHPKIESGDFLSTGWHIQIQIS